MRHERFVLENSDGDPIRGDVRREDEIRATEISLVVCHGFKGFKDWGFFPFAASGPNGRKTRIIRGSRLSAEKTTSTTPSGAGVGSCRPQLP